jgi:hypothetical protein
MTVATAPIDWAARQSRLLGELARTVATKEPKENDWYGEAVRHSVATLNELRGEQGRGFVSQLEANVEEFLRSENHVEQSVLHCAQLREDLTNVEAEPGELEWATSELVKVESELQADLSTRRTIAADMWEIVCRLLGVYTKWIAASRTNLPRLPSSRYTRVNWEIVAELETLTDRVRALLRYAVVAGTEWREAAVPDHLAAEVWTVRISPFAYLRAMWNLFWSAIRHPLSETTIDLSTGRVLYRT